MSSVSVISSTMACAFACFAIAGVIKSVILCFKVEFFFTVVTILEIVHLVEVVVKDEVDEGRNLALYRPIRHFALLVNVTCTKSCEFLPVVV